MNAAGILLLCPDTGAVFLAKRSSRVSNPHTWSAPGGHIEPGESWRDAADREFAEEVGYLPRRTQGEALAVRVGNIDYCLFIDEVSVEEASVLLRRLALNWENTAAAWFPLSAPPMPLHPGMQRAWPTIVHIAHHR